MDLTRIFVLLILLLLLSPKVLRPIIALLFGRAVGRAAMAKQPTRITLRPANASQVRLADRIEPAARTLMRDGFKDAGWFSVTEMPGVFLRLLAHESEHRLAAIYDHPQAGTWSELVQAFENRTRRSFVNMKSTGLAPLKGIEVTYLPGVDASELLQRARAEQPPHAALPVTAATASGFFADGFAQVMALRKEQGVSRGEVVKVAMRKSPQKAG